MMVQVRTAEIILNTAVFGEISFLLFFWKNLGVVDMYFSGKTENFFKFVFSTVFQKTAEFLSAVHTCTIVVFGETVEKKSVVFQIFCRSHLQHRMALSINAKRSWKARIILENGA